jgi:hypothetical protein
MSAELHRAEPTPEPPTGLPTIRFVEPTGAYVAGACNIGPAEIARRRRTGWLGLAGAVVLGLALVALGTPALLRLVIGAPIGALVFALLPIR